MLDTSPQTPTPEASAPSYKPVFSPPFLDMMMDYGFSALRSYAETAIDRPELLDLVDGLWTIAGHFTRRAAGKALTLEDDDTLITAIGSISYSVPALGEPFVTPIGEMPLELWDGAK